MILISIQTGPIIGAKMLSRIWCGAEEMLQFGVTSMMRATRGQCQNECNEHLHSVITASGTGPRSRGSYIRDSEEAYPDHSAWCDDAQHPIWYRDDTKRKNLQNQKRERAVILWLSDMNVAQVVGA